MILAVVDAAPLYAALDRRESEHTACLRALKSPDVHLVIPILVVTEVCYLIEQRLGPTAEAAFLSALQEDDVRGLLPEDLARMSVLVTQYADFPLGAVGASVIALAERLGTDTVITLDRRHFAAVKPLHCEHLRLLPEQG